MSKEKAVRRIRAISALVLVFASVLFFRLYTLQIVEGDKYKNKADRQYLQSNYDFFDRGSIYFQSKDGGLVSAATLKIGFIVALNPKQIKDPESVYERLNSVIPVDKASFDESVSKKDDPYEEVAHRVSSDDAEKIKTLDITGVTLYKERWRFYPGGSMASHALGLLAFKGDEYGGRYGLERYYENNLNRNSNSVFVNFFAEIFSNIKDTLSFDNTLEGEIVTTIEPSVQSFLESQIKKVDDSWQSDFTGGIIMNPKNGEILALSIYPNFDPNNFQDVENPKIFSNPLVENVFEMGSIIKPLTMAAGLDSGAVTAQTTYFDAGFLTLDRKTISNFDGKGRGLVDMQEVLSQSLNTGAAYVAGKIGNKKFAEYMLNYGINQKTGIDLPNETQGLADNLESPRNIEYATASFGQGIAMTPIETVRALASLGNGGFLVTPHLAKKINYKIGGSKEISFPPPTQILKSETSEEISRMLVKVVDTALLGGTVKIENYSIAAKTGTAQIANLNEGGYYDD
ncbi:MAG: hypothetical protein CO184_00625, partial [Candidatus Zambryskibacteria bacterium CG_4_9_14_3_um_filter_40_16]